MELANLLSSLAVSSGSCDYPDASNVLLGVTYANGALTGSMICAGGTVEADPARYSPAVIMQRLIIQHGLGTLPAPGVVGSWPTFYSADPDTPDSVIVCRDTTARDDGRFQLTGKKFQHVGVQVKVRSKDHTSAYAKAKAVALTLDEDVMDELVTIGETVYKVHSISRIGDILDLGKESPASKRTIMVFNTLMSIRCEHVPGT